MYGAKDDDYENTLFKKELDKTVMARRFKKLENTFSIKKGMNLLYI